jgi:hypothetical protein
MQVEIRASNPRYPGSAARMADGRLFTDYRGNCQLVQGTNTFDRKQLMQKTGVKAIQADRSTSVTIAGTTGCVDTMVPELTKRVCSWNGCQTLPAQPVGIGQGRMYWPGSSSSVSDPDDMASMVTIPNSYPVHSGLSMYGSPPPAYSQGVPVVPARRNRYSAPYFG